MIPPLLSHENGRKGPADDVPPPYYTRISWFGGRSVWPNVRDPGKIFLAARNIFPGSLGHTDRPKPLIFLLTVAAYRHLDLGARCSRLKWHVPGG